MTLIFLEHFFTRTQKSHNNINVQEMRITFILFDMLFIQKLEHMELRGKKTIRKRNKNGTKEEKRRGNENFTIAQLIIWLPHHSFMPYILEKTHIFAIHVPPKKSSHKNQVWRLKLKSATQTKSWTTQSTMQLSLESWRYQMALSVEWLLLTFKCGSTWRQESLASHFLHEQLESEVEVRELLLEESIHIYLFPQWGEDAHTCYRKWYERGWDSMWHLCSNLMNNAWPVHNVTGDPKEWIPINCFY